MRLLVALSLLLLMCGPVGASGYVLNQGGLLCTSEEAAAWTLRQGIERELDAAGFRKLVDAMAAEGHCGLTDEDWPIDELIRYGQNSPRELRVIEVRISEGENSDRVWTTVNHMREIDD